MFSHRWISVIVAVCAASAQAALTSPTAQTRRVSAGINSVSTPSGVFGPFNEYVSAPPEQIGSARQTSSISDTVVQYSSSISSNNGNERRYGATVETFFSYSFQLLQPANYSLTYSRTLINNGILNMNFIGPGLFVEDFPFTPNSYSHVYSGLLSPGSYGLSYQQSTGPGPGDQRAGGTGQFTLTLTPLPEPASLLLLSCGSVLLLCRRRCRNAA